LKDRLFTAGLRARAASTAKVAYLSHLFFVEKVLFFAFSCFFAGF
jgi:hypothetical protein